MPDMLLRCLGSRDPVIALTTTIRNVTPLREKCGYSTVKHNHMKETSKRKKDLKKKDKKKKTRYCRNHELTTKAGLNNSWKC